MNRTKILKDRLVLILIALVIPIPVFALKVDNTHYRFCVMDDAIISDYAAVSAESTNQLPMCDAYWYSSHGIKLYGTQTSVKSQNVTTTARVLMTEPFSGSSYDLRHSWFKGYNGVAYQQTTDFYIAVDAPTGVSLSKLSPRMTIGSEEILSPTLSGTFTSFSGNGYFDYSYSSSDESIVSITSGKIIAHNLGKATISVEVFAKNGVYSGSYYIGKSNAEIEVVGNMEPLSISLECNELELNIGEEKSISANILPEDAKCSITWYSSNNNVATIEDGKILGISRGQCIVEAKTDNGLSAKCNVSILGEEDYKCTLNVVDVNRNWGTIKSVVVNNQPHNYYLLQDNQQSIIFSSYVDDMKVFISYKFDENQKLCASAYSLPYNYTTQNFSDKLFSQYDNDLEVIDGLEVKKENDEIITIDTSTSFNNGRVITIGFSYFEPIEERTDCVDLGLSVRWATCNLGAASPTGVGNFYAWSEKSSKTEYWRENYSYATYNASQYSFNYNNPSTNICGTSYDVATSKLGEGWKMPSLEEANELISKCTWTKENIEGVNVYRVTGPNGNSIIIPIISWKKQTQNYVSNKLHLATGQCSSTGSEDCYVITANYTKDSKGTIGYEWKAWGYNIRPVYTK